VVYDEIELFRDSKDQQFEYPYEARKTVIASITADPKSQHFDSDEKLIEF
jgi:hypothetical protein